MTFSVQSQFVSNADPVVNRNSSGTAEQRGGFTFGEIDITSYTNGGEVIPAHALGLSKVYSAMFQGSETDTYAPRSFEVAAGLRSGTLNIDTAGTGTEVSAATDVGRFCYVAWGELLGSGTT